MVLEGSVGSVAVVAAVLPSAGLAELSCCAGLPPSRKVDQPFSRSSRSRVVSSTCTDTVDVKDANSARMAAVQMWSITHRERHIFTLLLAC